MSTNSETFGGGSPPREYSKGDIMKVFVVTNLQGDGETAVCASLERAKEWLKESITRYQDEAYPDSANDPNPWEGWEFSNASDTKIYFGTQKDSPEGTITEMKVIS